MFGTPSSRRVRRGTQPRGRTSRPAPRNLSNQRGSTTPRLRRAAGNRAGRDRLRRFLVRRRRLLAGLLVALACGITVEAYLPPDARTSPLVTAARDLPSGHVLQTEDLRLASLPTAAAPPGAFSDSETVAGRRLAAPLQAGTVLTDSVLVGPGLLTGAPAGTVAVPLRPADPAAAGLLTPGVLVDVVLAAGTGFDGSTETSLLASGVPVLWIAGETAGGGTWPGSREADAGLVVVAARSPDAAVLAGASERGNLYLVLSGG